LFEKTGSTSKENWSLSIQIDRFFEHILFEKLLKVDVERLVGFVGVVRIGVFRPLVEQPEQDGRIAFPYDRPETFLPA
jgi:hypothetical protein